MSDPISPAAAAEPARVRRIRDYIKRYQLKGARRRRPAGARAPAEPWWSKVSRFRTIVGLVGIVASAVPFVLLFLFDQVASASGAPHLITTIRDTWLSVVLAVLFVGAVIGVLAYAGPGWRRWVRMDRTDERIEGTPPRAEFTTRDRLRQILFYLVGGLFFAALPVWLSAPLVGEIGLLATAGLVVGIVFLHAGFLFFGIAGYGYFLDGKILPALGRAGFGATVAAAGSLFACAGLIGRLDWLTTS